MAAYIKSALEADRQKRRGSEGQRGQPNFAGSAPGSKLRTTLITAVREAEELAKE